MGFASTLSRSRRRHEQRVQPAHWPIRAGYDQIMQGHRRRRLAVVACALITTMLFTSGAKGSPPPGKVSFSTPTQFPKFNPSVYDYVVRCHDGPVTVNGHASGGWLLAIDNQTFRSGDFSRNVALRAGKAFTATAKNGPNLYRYHVRCLPDDFPDYTFTHDGPASPRFFSVDEAFVPQPSDRYAMIFDDHGVPVWWYRAPAWDVRVLPSGKVLWFNFSTHEFEIHELDGSLIRTLVAVGHPPTCTTFSSRAAANYLVGADVDRRAPSTPAPTADRARRRCVNAELQEVSSGGRPVVGLEQRGPHRARGDGAPVALGDQPRRDRRLRHRPLELDRARRQLRDRLVPDSTPSTRSERAPVTSSGSWVELDDASRASTVNGDPRGAHPRGPARRAAAFGRDADGVRQSHQLDTRSAAGRALPDQRAGRHRDAAAVDHRSRRSRPPPAAARRDAWPTATG